MLRLGDTYGGKVARKRAQAGAAALLNLVLPILRGVSSERAESPAKRRSKPVPGVSSAEAAKMLRQAWQRFQAAAAPMPRGGLRTSAGFYPPTDIPCRTEMR